MYFLGNLLCWSAIIYTLVIRHQSGCGFINGDSPIAREGGFIQYGYKLTTSNNRTRSTLTILDTKLEDDKSQYHCQLGSSSEQAKLTVMPQKLGLAYPECEANLTAINIDRTVTMKCSAAGGNPRPELQWYRNRIKLETREDFFDGNSSYFEELTHTLTAHDEDAIFMCKAEGVAVDGNQICQIHLDVSPIVVVKVDKPFSVGDSLDFTCLVMSPWNITDYIWTVDNTLITNSGHKTWTINNLETSDIGTEIKCMAVTHSGLNGVGSIVILLSNEINTKIISGVIIGTLYF